MGVDLRMAVLDKSPGPQDVVGVVVGIDDGLDGLGGYFSEFGQDFFRLFHGGHGVHDDQAVTAFDHKWNWKDRNQWPRTRHP